MQAKEQYYYSPEEYLKLETNAEFKSEYYNGEIFPMVGGLPNHNRIALNFSASLNFALKGQKYDVFITDMRLQIPQKGLYTYPDIMVIAGELELLSGRKDTITNPVMITEVLSDATEAYDRGEKFKFYRSLPSLQEYILISQSEMHIEQFSKTPDHKWILSEYDGANTILNLTSLTFQISLADIYDKVEFTSEKEQL